MADHFHVIQHVGKAVNQVISRWAKSEQGKKALANQRHLFLRNHEDLSVEEEQSRASASRAPFLRSPRRGNGSEELRSWYASASAATAASQLDTWIARVKGEGPAERSLALSAFRNWRQEILAFFEFLPTRSRSGFVEGKNNRTKTIMRQGSGYRNRHNLRVRILLEVA